MLSLSKLHTSTIAGFSMFLLVLMMPSQVSAVGYGGGGGGGGGSSSGGGGGGVASGECYTLPPVPPGGFAIEAQYNGNSADEVTLSLRAGSAARMAISNSPTFVGASQEPYVATRAWRLSSEVGARTVYARFYNSCGLSTPVVSVVIEPRPTSGALGQNGQVLGERIVLIDELIAKLRYGQRNEDVRTLQSELKRLGYLPASLKVTTYYGPLTRGAVNAYLAQIDVASIDIDALIAELKFGTSGSKVTLLQRALQVRGYFPAKVRVTAYYGTITRAAVNAYLAAK